MNPTEPLAVTLQVVDVLEQLNIPYFIGGSLASTVHGVVRATLDVDLIADIQHQNVADLVEAFQSSFYIDGEMIYDAILHQTSFNIIHLDTMFKVDIFIPKGRPFDQAEFRRRTRQVLSTEPERSAYVASAEDILLAKLEWYNLGGRVSDRQWGDIQKLLKVQAEQLDYGYLRQWSTQLDVADLLTHALEDQGI
jgi:hypothetical protein